MKFNDPNKHFAKKLFSFKFKCTVLVHKMQSVIYFFFYKPGESCQIVCSTSGSSSFMTAPDVSNASI